MLCVDYLTRRQTWLIETNQGKSMEFVQCIKTTTLTRMAHMSSTITSALYLRLLRDHPLFRLFHHICLITISEFNTKLMIPPNTHTKSMAIQLKRLNLIYHLVLPLWRAPAVWAITFRKTDRFQLIILSVRLHLPQLCMWDSSWILHLFIRIIAGVLNCINPSETERREPVHS